MKKDNKKALYESIMTSVAKEVKKVLNEYEGSDIASSFNKNTNGVVDLGLPSGTLWCKCNLGANTETEYGDYYSWGELTTKSEYTEENYIHEDNFKQLPPEYDVATLTLGKNYSIPTRELCNELLEYTNNEWVHDYNKSGVDGLLFISKINGNTLFIPAAGVRMRYSIYYDNDRCYVWSSSLDTAYPDGAWYMYFNYDKYARINSSSRYRGLSVRPVFKK